MKSKIEIVTSYFAMASRLEAAGYTVISIANYQPKGCHFPELTCLAPSQFMLSLAKQKRWDQYRVEYRRYHAGKENYIRAFEKIQELGLNKIALVCWEKDDINCHRGLVREIFRKARLFEIDMVEFDRYAA